MPLLRLEDDDAAALAWLRQRVQIVIGLKKPNAAVLRTPEHGPRGGNKESARRRLRLEGVLLEVCQSSGVPITSGALATISKRLGSQSAKSYIERGDLRGIDISTFPAPLREAILVAVSGLPKA